MTQQPFAGGGGTERSTRSDDGSDAGHAAGHRAQGPSHRSRSGRQGHRRARHQAAHARHHRAEREEHVRRAEPDRAAEFPALRAHRQRVPPQLSRRHDRARRAADRHHRSRGAAWSGQALAAGRLPGAAHRGRARQGRRRRDDVPLPVRRAAAGAAEAAAPGLGRRRPLQSDRLDDDDHRGVLVPLPLRHGRRYLLRLDGSRSSTTSSTSQVSSTR